MTTTNDGNNDVALKEYEKIVCEQLNKIFGKNIEKFDTLMTKMIESRINESSVKTAIETMIIDGIKSQVTDAINNTMDEMKNDGTYKGMLETNIKNIFDGEIKSLLVSNINNVSNDARRAICDNTSQGGGRATRRHRVNQFKIRRNKKTLRRNKNRI